jgi:hypothetical protein
MNTGRIEDALCYEALLFGRVVFAAKTEDCDDSSPPEGTSLISHCAVVLVLF